MSASSLVQVSDDSLSYIFQSILDWHLDTKGFPHYIRKIAPRIIKATLQLYSNVSKRQALGRGRGARCRHAWTPALF